MRALPLAFSSFLLVTSAHAADATWNVNADGSWVTDSNWNPAAAPGSTSSTTNTDTATFGTIISAARAITVDANRNIFGINFAGNSSAYALSGGNLLLTSGGTIQTSGSGSTHTDTINSAISLQGDYTFATNSSTTGRILAFGSLATITSAATSGTTTLTLSGTGTSASNAVAGIVSNGGDTNVVAINKTGAGTWTLSGANTFTGGLTVSAGTLTTGNSAAAGASGTAVTLAGGTLNMSTAIGNSINVTASSALTLANNTFWSGALTGNSGTTLTISVGSTASPSGNWTAVGGTLLFTGGNTLRPNIAGGTTFGSANAVWDFGSSTMGFSPRHSGTGGSDITILMGALRSTGTGMTLSSQNNLTGGRVVYQVGAQNLSDNFSGRITENAAHPVAFTKVGTGTQTLAGTNTYTGATTINAGTLQFAKVLSLYNNTTGSWTAANIRAASGGTLAFNIGGAGEFTTTDVTTLLTNLATSTSATNGMSAGSSLAFDTTNASGSNFTIADVLADTTGATGGARGVTKLGTGSLALTNTNTYTGATTVNAGTLNISSGSSLATGSAVTVQNTGSTLSGAGTVNGNINIKNGAILAAGDSGGMAIGILTASTGANTLNLESESIFAWGLAGSTDTDSGGVRGADYDAVDAANVSADSNAIFRVILGTIPLADMQTPGNTFWSQTQTWSNIFSSTFSGFNSPVQVFNASGTDVSNTTSLYGSFTANGSTLTWAAVPEPATHVMAGLMIGAGLLRRRRNPAR